MKKTLWFILTIVLWSPCLNAQVPQPLGSSPIAVDPSISPTAVEVGPHHRIWQTVTVDDQGGAITNSYTELATGLNFFNPATDQWEESQPQFKITENGYAAATNGQHQVVISPALNDANGAVTLQAPDGKRFRSTILGLNLYDRLSGKGLLIAELTPSVGQLIAPNQVFFPDCFDTLNADVRLTYERGQFHQDVILHEGLDLKRLETLGFAADTSRLEIWTEFFESPDPTVRTRVMESEIDPSLRAAMAEPDVVEEDLDFGVMKMPAGRAYLQEAARNLEQSVVVPKQWVRINERKFLVESLSLDALKPLFATLPVSRSGLANLRTSPRNEKDYAQRQPPSPSLVQGTTNTILLAQGQRLGTPGVIWDYVTINGSLTNYTIK